MTFDAVRIYPFGATSPGDGDPDSCIYIELELEPVVVDVMELDRTLTEILGDLAVPEGDYTHLAIHVAELWGEDVDGELVPVHLPPSHDGWLKLLVPFTVEQGTVTGIELVIDLQRSLREVRPGSGEYLMVPVVWGDVTWGPGPGSHHQEGGPHHGG